MPITSALIQKYAKYSIPKLKEKATLKFNEFIRKRDKDYTCISCNSKVEQAGHFYSGGHYPALKFNPDNVNGQCVRCNYFLSGNLNEYRKNLIVKIGIEAVEELDSLAAYYKKNGFKWNRFALIQVIELYKNN